METPFDRGQCQKAARVKVEPEPSPPPECVAVPIKKEPVDQQNSDCLTEAQAEEETAYGFVVKEEPSCFKGPASPGVSATADLYKDHTIKDELVIGPELLHCSTVTPVFYVAVPIKEEPEDQQSSDCLTKAQAEEETSYRIVVKEEGEPASPGGSATADLYKDHTIKDELVIGPELLHCSSVTPVFCHEQLLIKREVKNEKASEEAGQEMLCGAVSSGAGVAEALGRRCSVRLERLLLDAERRACRVGRRTYRLRPESEPRRAATPAAGTYRCHHCDKAFGHKSVLRKHIQNHLSTRLAHSRCSTREDSTSDRHQNLDTRAKPFKCSLEGKLRRHESTQTGEKLFHCKYCDHKCSLKGNLRIHEMTHTGVKPFKCNYCDYKCTRKQHLQIHEMTHTGVKPFHCNYCDYKCNVKGDLRRHEMTHTGVKPFKCNYCDFKCVRKEQLRRHEMTHTGVKPFKCNYCDYKCSRKQHLRIHEMTHTGVKAFHCNYCDYKCNVKGDFRRHEMTHTGVKPFKCNYCDYKCSRKPHLRIHEMTHTGVKAFHCNYCDYKCNVKGDLRRHEMTHTGVKPFKCNYCDYKCIRKQHLRRHEMTHTLE